MLTEFPVVVVDALLSKYVSDNDLRAIHQVSKGWKDLIEQRPLVNSRRLALAKTIREHKENILKSTQPLVLPPLVTDPKPTEESKSKEREDEKPGSGRALRPTSANNHVFVTPGTSSSRSTTRSKKSGSGRSVGSATRISSTPISSRFQRRYEAGLKLMAGQVLFSCPECKSPVASPLPSLTKKEKSKSNVIPAQSMDSGIEFPLTPSIEDARQEGSSSNLFEFKSPDFESINFSMIVTPPFTPPIYGEISNHPVSEGSFHDFQNTRSPSCPFLASTSALSISDSTHGVDCIISEGKPGTIPGFSGVQFSQDSGLGSPRVKLKSRGISPSPSLLRSLQSKQLKLKSSSSPSLLVSEVNNNDPNCTTDAPPMVLQCPDCSYRFCALCMFREHLGSECRLIGDMDAEEEEDAHACPAIPPSRPILKPRPRSANLASSGGVGKSSKKKGSLRRLAYL